MNSRERFFNRLEGKPVDRRPFGAILSLYGASLTGCPLQQYYNDAGAYAKGQAAVREAVLPDFLVGPFLLAGFGEAFGSTLHYSERYVPTLKRPAISSAAELSKLKVPDPESHPRLLFYREAVQQLSQTHGHEAVIVAIVLNPVDLPIMIMGLDAWLFTVLSDAPGTRRMLELATEFFVRFCEMLFRDGADLIAMPMAFFTRDITTEHLVTEFAFPALREALASAKGPFVLHHTGSSFFEYLELLDTLPGVTGLALEHHDNINLARTRIRRETVLLSGLDGPSLHTLSPDTIKARCSQILGASRDDQMFVPFATGTDVEMHTPLEHLTAIRQAVEEFGEG